MAISEGLGGGGVASPVFFPGVPSKIDEQAITYFLYFGVSKQKIIVFSR